MMESTHHADTARLEKLAAMEHERWSLWQMWMHDLCVRNPDGSLTIPAELVKRWERQARTPYYKLSEVEKTSDREQVARYWPLLQQSDGTGSASDG